MNMRIILTDTSAFVVTSRNNDNSEFYIRPKADFERELELGKGGIVMSNFNEGWREESTIIEMINSGKKFYTYNYSDKIFTEIIEVDGHIKSVSNETDVDNIGTLPL